MYLSSEASSSFSLCKTEMSNSHMRARGSVVGWGKRPPGEVEEGLSPDVWAPESWGEDKLEGELSERGVMCSLLSYPDGGQGRNLKLVGPRASKSVAC